MSMLSIQIAELRDAAKLYDGMVEPRTAELLREAADTIESLRDRLQNQAFALGMQDALGSETCELVETDSYRNANETIHVLECSVCGKTCEHVNGSYPRCPHCGRKVER